MSSETQQNEEQLNPSESTERVNTAAETAESLGAQIDGQKAAADTELTGMQQDGKDKFDKGATDPDADPTAIKEAGEALNKLNQEAEAVVSETKAEMDKLNDSPEEKVTPVDPTQDDSAASETAEDPATPQGEASSAAESQPNASETQNLINEIIGTIDPNNENHREAAELITKFPEIFKDFDDKIEALGAEDGYSKENLKKKSLEIKKSFAKGVLNGHMTAEEAEALIGAVEIVCKTGNSPEEQARIDAMLSELGSNTAIYIDPDNSRFSIFADTLKDSPELKDREGSPTEPNLQNSVDFAMGYCINEKIIENNGVLEKVCKDLADDEVLKNLQSEEIRKILETQKDITLATKEVTAVFTGKYLNSDGSFGDFMKYVLWDTDKVKAEAAFGVTEDEARQIASMPEDQRNAALEQKPVLKKYLDICKTFYEEIATQMKSDERKELILSDDEEAQSIAAPPESPSLLGSSLGGGGGGGGGHESSLSSASNAGKAQPAMGGGGHAPGNPQQESFWSAIGGLMKAFGDDLLPK